MKNIKTIIAFAMLFGGNIFPMRMTEMGEQAAAKQAQRRFSYFIYSLETTDGIWISKKMAEENSEYIKALSQRSALHEIGLPFSIESIKLAFNILSYPINVHDLSLEQLINVIVIFDFLQVSSQIMKTILEECKQSVEEHNEIDINKILKKLPDYIQKLLLMDSAVDYLKNCIIKMNAQDRKRMFGQLGVQEYKFVNAVDFSSNDIDIIAGYDKLRNNLILWHSRNYTQQVLNQDNEDRVHRSGVNAVAFSPDGAKVASSGSSFAFISGDLILWDISDRNNIMRLNLINENIGNFCINSIAFSPYGNCFVAGGYGDQDQNNLMLWDISNQNNIVHTFLIGHPNNVTSVAFSSDGKYIVSSCEGGGDNLFLWDIADPNNSIPYNLTDKLAGYAHLVAFHPDGKSFVSCGNQLILWNISDPNNISSKVLIDNFAEISDIFEKLYMARGFSNLVTSLAFSHDGKTIALGYDGGCTLLRMSDVTPIAVSTNIVQIDTLGSIRTLAFSPDDKRIIMGGLWKFTSNLVLYNLLTDRDEALLQQLKNYTADQVRLIYQLCVRFLQGKTIQRDSEEQKIFVTLPEDMQNLLNDNFSQRRYEGLQ